jgi:hypothetical protein
MAAASRWAGCALAWLLLTSESSLAQRDSIIRKLGEVKESLETVGPFDLAISPEPA